MPRTPILCLVLLWTGLAQAGDDPTGRAVDGSLLPLAPGSLVVSWRLDDSRSVAALGLGEELAARTGAPLLAINTDGVGAVARAGQYLRARRSSAQPLVDADGGWQRRLGLVSGAVVVLGDGATVVARGSDLRDRDGLVAALGGEPDRRPPVTVADTGR